jgi:hypothetical protein
LLFEHDLVGKPVPTFPDHALKQKSRKRGAAGTVERRSFIPI